MRVRDRFNCRRINISRKGQLAENEGLRSIGPGERSRCPLYKHAGMQLRMCTPLPMLINLLISLMNTQTDRIF